MNISHTKPGMFSQLLQKKHQFAGVDDVDNAILSKISVSNNFTSHLLGDEGVIVYGKIPQDDRAARMFEVLGDQNFDSSRTNQRINLIMILWIMRYKFQIHVKRLFDLLISLMVLPFLLPIMAVTAIVIKINSPGPVFFKQVRVGKWGKLFDCYKFRSMYVDAEQRKMALMHLNEADQIVFKMKKDPRVTGVGRIIRKLSIDELPQILNVIKGDMSLVGPRPPVPYEVENYKYEHILRLNAVPGITGLQQISGRSELDFKRWVELDLQYIEEQSLFKDIEILLKTIPAVISGRGAY